MYIFTIKKINLTLCYGLDNYRNSYLTTIRGLGTFHLFLKQPWS